MMDQWLRQRGTQCWCPYEPPDKVIVGLNLIADTPPGEDVGEFWYDKDDELHIEMREPKP